MSRDDWKYKQKYKPAACTQPIWSSVIPADKRLEILRLIRNETQNEGRNLDECPKRKICITKDCLGRTLPWGSETARPYLEQLELTHDIRVNPISGEKELFLSTCQTCPLKAANTCNRQPCNQVLDQIKKDESVEPSIEFRDDISNISFSTEDNSASNYPHTIDEIPMEVLTDRKKEIVQQYAIESRDFRAIGKNVLDKDNKQAFVKLEFHSAMSKLKKVSLVREFIKEKGHLLTERQYAIFNLVFLENQTMVAVAKEFQVSKQNIQQIISKILKKHNIVFQPYVKMHNNQPKYSNTGRFK